MLVTKPNHITKELFPMNIITSEAHFRQRVLKYSLKNGVELSMIGDNSTIDEIIL